MIDRLREWCTNIQIEAWSRIARNPGGTIAWYGAFVWWWAEKPRRIECPGCSVKFWAYGRLERPLFCSADCLNHADQDLHNMATADTGDEIPF